MGREQRTRTGALPTSIEQEKMWKGICGQHKVGREKDAQGDERVSLGGGINHNKMTYENDIRNPVT